MISRSKNVYDLKITVTERKQPARTDRVEKIHSHIEISALYIEIFSIALHTRMLHEIGARRMLKTILVLILCCYEYLQLIFEHLECRVVAIISAIVECNCYNKPVTLLSISVLK